MSDDIQETVEIFLLNIVNYVQVKVRANVDQFVNLKQSLCNVDRPKRAALLQSFWDHTLSYLDVSVTV